MRLYQQLVLFMLAATVLPLAGVGFWLLSASERALAARIGLEQRDLATAAARRAGTRFDRAIDGLTREAEQLDWLHLTDAERKGALSLLYGQSDLVSAVALVSPSNRILAGPLFTTDGEGGHPRFRDGAMQGAVAASGLQALARGGIWQTSVSSAYPSAATGRPAVAVAIKVGTAPDSPFAVAELSLEGLRPLLRALDPGDGRILLVGSSGKVLASSKPSGKSAPLSRALWAGIGHSLSHAPVGSLRAEKRWVSAATVPGKLGWVTVVEVNAASALAPVHRMRRTVLISVGVSLAILLLLGALFTRRLNLRIGRVMEGAEAFGKGELGRRIELSGGDELTDLARTFNRMGGELEAARARLLRWNDDLRQKVDEATAELRAAQAQLVEAQKLAAVGQLGAGVAHEINNPLAGILGHTQLLLLDRTESDDDFEALRKIEQSAKRCKEITQNLLRFSQQRDVPALRPIDLAEVVRDALALVENQIHGEGITLALSVPEKPVRVNGDPGHLSQVVLALLSNARTAVAGATRKKIDISVVGSGEEVALRIADSGKGISPENLPRIFEPFFTTKDVWSNVGLGLSVAYRIASEHHGKITVETEVGKGSVFTLRLPPLQGRSSTGAVDERRASA